MPSQKQSPLRFLAGVLLLGGLLTWASPGATGDLEIVFDRCGDPGKDHLCTPDKLEKLHAERKAAAAQAEHERIRKAAEQATRDGEVKALTDRYGAHRKTEAENLLNLQKAAEAARPKLASPKPKKCRKEPISRVVTSGVARLSRSEAESRVRMPVGLCPNGETPQRGGLSCSSVQRTVTVSRDDPCFASASTCPKQTLWTCSETFSCVTPREICETASEPSAGSRQ